ncbi:flagellar biosynthesis protein FlhF [Simiduia agarivorans]|uniref:Flagellar biosynthesis protein FlhF n=1 Tax=Simiduia agarivorans (strain DSM 21679 / JCM 13881 / BCRC 17597 / SA1) TaxID=1117647 RepID=K4KF82_SIMAS|nr:flagellar biosynthesis protein FlhF [Simiduia agarivorans]AFU97704.1 flagellar biosynthetic protein FlhF [Simiduia agarivorans SA1 = DSM 21679]
MATKRIVAANMRRALEIAREQLGESAIILSTKRHPDGVELLATQETGGQVPEDQRAFATQPQQPEEAAAPLASDNAWQFQDTLDKLIRETPSEDQPAGLQRAAEIERARRKLEAKATAPKLNVFGQPVSERFSADQTTQSLGQPGDLWASQLSHPGREPEQAAASVTPVAVDEPYVRKRYDADAATEQMDQLKNELAQMRQLLAERLSADTATPATQSLKTKLGHLGLPAFLCERLVAGVNTESGSEQMWAEALALLAQRLPVNAKDWVAQGGVYAFVGPTGVGKTTTLAKMAVRYAMVHGVESIGLISIDQYRLAAHEQLNALGQILGIPVSVPSAGQTLAQLVKSLSGKSLILIDTAGLRPGDERLTRQQAALAAVKGMNTLLVMAANSQIQAQKACFHAYLPKEGRQGLVLTKLDEAISLGETLGLVMNKRTPVLYTTAGQEIPQDLDVAKGHKLVACAVQKLAEATATHKAQGQQLRAEHL